MSVLALLGLAGFVLFGSVIPIVPTGAAVSAAAVVVRADQPWEIGVVVLVGAAGAYLGDVITYGALRVWGAPLAQRFGWLQRDNPQGALASLREGIERNEVRTLLVSRLLPGGRIPVLVAAALGGYPWQRYAVAAVGATLLWSATYAVIGIVGNAFIPDQRLAVLVVVVAALALTAIAQLVQTIRRRRAVGRSARGI